MTHEELVTYAKELEKRLLEHRYRYYVQDAPVIEDFIYDLLERTYAETCKEAGVDSICPLLVDWNPNIPRAKEAAERVLNGTDFHSIWLKEMEPVWAKLGKPETNKYVVKLNTEDQL